MLISETDSKSQVRGRKQQIGLWDVGNFHWIGGSRGLKIVHNLENSYSGPRVRGGYTHTLQKCLYMEDSASSLSLPFFHMTFGSWEPLTPISLQLYCG